MSSYVDVDVNTSVQVEIEQYLDEIDEDVLVKEIMRRKGNLSGSSDEIKKVIYELDNFHTTEEVKEVYDFIVGSYHYDVFKGELDEKVNENT